MKSNTVLKVIKQAEKFKGRLEKRGNGDSSIEDEYRASFSSREPTAEDNHQPEHRRSVRQTLFRGPPISAADRAAFRALNDEEQENYSR